MKEFKGKVALITGAGDGFGKEFVKECIHREMKIVAVDIDESKLNAIKDLCEQSHADYLTIVCDVTKFEDVQASVQQTMEKYGQIDLLMNNAGVAIMGPVWELPIRDFHWITQANVMSHVYYMNLVIPIMLKQQTDCHIVNTASVAGLITANGMCAYHMSKHAAVGLAESVYYDLQAINSKIKMSIYCPGFVQTDLHHSESHRPVQYQDPQDPYYQSPTFYAGQKLAEHLITTGIPIDSVGMRVFNAIEDEQFYILTHPIYNTLIGKRVKNMLSGKGPNLQELKG